MNLLETAADVRKLEITTRRLVNNVMAGEYHTAFKGQGMEFSEVREYQEGDDIRHIDWNVTARTGEPFVKRYIEQRELTVIFAVDVSGSSIFGSLERRKRSLEAIVAAVLGFSALKNNDRVGVLLFSDKVERYIPPKKGKKHVLRCIQELLREPESRGTDIVGALRMLNRLQRRKAIVFLISDFQQENLRRSLAVTNSRHDLIAVSILDPREVTIPDVGIINLEDAETGESVSIDTSSRRVRDVLQGRLKQRRDTTRRLLNSLKVDHIELRTDQDYSIPLINFFARRIRRMGGP